MVFQNFLLSDKYFTFVFESVQFASCKEDLRKSFFVFCNLPSCLQFFIYYKYFSNFDLCIIAFLEAFDIKGLLLKCIIFWFQILTNNLWNVRNLTLPSTHPRFLPLKDLKDGLLREQVPCFINYDLSTNQKDIWSLTIPLEPIWPISHGLYPKYNVQEINNIIHLYANP